MEESTQDFSRRLNDLVTYPHEDLGVEIKSWLNLRTDEDKANLAQALLALANFGGGYVIIGFSEKGNSWLPAPNRPSDLSSYEQDDINGIVQKYADPPFQCLVHNVQNATTGESFPVIIVPSDLATPIRSKRDGPTQQHIRADTYYIRGPGPCSRPINSALEWDTLISRCVRAKKTDLLDNIRDIQTGFLPGESQKHEMSVKENLNDWLSKSKDRFISLVQEKLPHESPSRFRFGTWSCAYSINGQLRGEISLNVFHQQLVKAQGHETGWPPWWMPTLASIAPYSYEGLIECWLNDDGIFSDAAHSDFWRASPEGKLFLIRGYQEDGYPSKTEPGTVLDVTLPIWRLGECLLHAERFARLVAPDSDIAMMVHWEGLKGRRLSNWAKPQMLWFGSEHQICKQELVNSFGTMAATDIENQLPEIIKKLTQPLYEAFSFYEPPLSMIIDNLKEMMRH